MSIVASVAHVFLLAQDDGTDRLSWNFVSDSQREGPGESVDKHRREVIQVFGSYDV